MLANGQDTVSRLKYPSPLCSFGKQLAEAAPEVMAARETESFFKRVYDAWIASYKKNRVVYFAYTDKNNPWQYEGREDISKAVKEMFSENPDPIDGDIFRSNFRFGVGDNEVTVTYDQLVGDTNTMELRVLVKVDGEYQITMMNAIGNSSYE